MKRFLLITDNFPPVIGGSATVYTEICRRNADIAVVLTSGAGAGCKDDEGSAFPVHRLPYLRTPFRPRHKKPAGNIWAALDEAVAILKVSRAILRIVRKHDIGVIVIGELVYLGWITYLVDFLIKKPVIIYCHGEEISVKGDFFYANKRQNFLDKSTKLIAVSKFCENAIVSRYGIDSRKIRIIMNGVDCDRFKPRSPDARLIARYGIAGRTVIVGVGRHVERKGFQRLVEAMPLIRAAIPDIALLLIGEGPETPALQRAAVTAGVEDVVVFGGRIDDAELADHYSLGKIFAMPNYTLENGDQEGFGLVFLEANACGLPAVGGNSGGASEAIVDHVTGRLVYGHGDAAVKEIADIVLSILGDPTTYDAMSAAAIQHALANSWSMKATEFRQLIEAT